MPVRMFRRDSFHDPMRAFGGRSDVRTLAFPPDTGETREAGIAGDLFVMVFPMLDYPVREIIRLSRPFDAYVEQRP